MSASFGGEASYHEHHKENGPSYVDPSGIIEFCAEGLIHIENGAVVYEEDGGYYYFLWGTECLKRKIFFLRDNYTLRMI